jgi:hypothetical protein
MGQVHNGFAFAYLVGFLVLSQAPVSAQAVCSLTVVVNSPEGERLAVAISVEEENGRVIRRDAAIGEARFCDLGIRPVTVTVGSDGMCNQVVVRRVPITENDNYFLRVIYDPKRCQVLHKRPLLQCVLLFRIADAKGEWLAGARVRISAPFLSVVNGTLKPVQSEKAGEADLYGRVRFSPELGSTIRGRVILEGFHPKDFEFRCSEVWQEYVIRLDRAAPAP